MYVAKRFCHLDLDLGKIKMEIHKKKLWPNKDT